MLLRSVRLRVLPLAGLTLALASIAAARPVAEVFEESCASCHGVDGKGQTPMGRKARARDLSESKLSETEIERQIREGSKDQRRPNRMSGFADKLTADEIKALVEYVTSFRVRGN